jgi:hemin uptake protein HemP
MIFPATSAQKNPSTTTAHSHQLLENATSEESSDLMLMNLFDATLHSESSSSSTSSSTAQRPIQIISSSSVLDNVNETAFHHHGASNTNINNSLSINMPSDGRQESGLASSLPHELSHHTTSVLSTSPVWKTQVSEYFLIN